MRPLAADLYGRYREWIGAAIEAGMASGEFRSERQVGELADLAVAVIDGAGVRALIRDPALGIERARELIGELLCDELGLEPGALASGASTE